MSEYKDILVYCEIIDGKVSCMTSELLSCANYLASKMGQKVTAILIGNKVSNFSQEVISSGADKVYVIDNATFENYVGESHLPIIHKLLKEINPLVFLLGHNSIGRELAPRLAFKLNTFACLDCISLDIDPGTNKLLLTKPVFGGNAQATYSSEINPQIITVRSKSFSPYQTDDTRGGEIINVPAEIDPASVKVKFLGRHIDDEEGIKLEDASVIVSGGRGIGDTSGFDKLKELSQLLNGTVGASRAACDNYWVPENRQIGLTGKIVNPELYIAIALSGASQHLSGCSRSKIIVAINKDKDANIFNVSNFGVVGDWKQVIPAFTARIKQLNGK